MPVARWLDALPFRAIHSILLRLSKAQSRKGVYEFLERHFMQIPAGSTILSVGAGGPVNDLLERHSLARSFTVVQLDIDSRREPDVVGDICTADLGECKFEVVVMSEVLEHVHSPHLAVANVHRLLTHGGKLLATVPFMLPIHEAPVDYYRYTRHGLQFLLQGFSDVSIRERNGYIEAIGVIWLRLLQSETTSGRLAALFIAPLVILCWPVTLLLSLTIRSRTATTGYVVVATK